MKRALAIASTVVSIFFLMGFVHMNMLAKPSSQLSNAYSTFYDGSNDYVTIGQPANLEWDPNAKEATISAWIKPAGLVNQRIVVAKAGMSTNSVSYVMGHLNSSAPYAVVGDGNNASGTMTSGTWYHLCLTVRNVGGTYTFYMFKDGSQVATGTAGADQNTTLDWLIGASRWDTNSSDSYPFSGRIDEVTFWDTAFTDVDVAALRVTGRANNPAYHSKSAYLLHWYRMGDGPSDSYPTINDQVGTADGTMTNMGGAGNFENTYPGEP